MPRFPRLCEENYETSRLYDPELYNSLQYIDREILYSENLQNRNTHLYFARICADQYTSFFEFLFILLNLQKMQCRISEIRQCSDLNLYN